MLLCHSTLFTVEYTTVFFSAMVSTVKLLHTSLPVHVKASLAAIVPQFSFCNSPDHASSVSYPPEIRKI